MLDNLTQEDLSLLYKVLSQFWYGLSLYDAQDMTAELKAEEDRAGELMSRIAPMIKDQP